VDYNVEVNNELPFTLVINYALYKTLDMIMSIRVREDQGERGLDYSQKGELFT